MNRSAGLRPGSIAGILKRPVLEAGVVVKALGWEKPYHVDADLVRLETMDRFIAQ